MALSKVLQMGNTLGSFVQNLIERTLEYRNHLGPYHWVALGVGLTGVVTWKLLARPRGIPPGPRGLPVVGNILQMTESPHLDFMEFGKQYGDVFSVYLGGKLMVVLNSHQAIKEAFVTRGTMFADRPSSVHDEGQDEKSLFTENYGDVFSSKKKFAVMALRSAGFGTKEAETQMLISIDDVIEYLQKQNSQPVDLLLPTQKACANVIMTILFRKHFSWDDPELSEMVKNVEDFIALLTGPVLFADMVPRWMVPLFFRRVLKNLSDFSNTMINRYTMPYIQEHKKVFDPSNVTDFVDYYLKGSDMSDKTLANHCLHFFPDAMSTTAHQISWNMLYLAKYPDIQTKIQQELDKVLGSRSPSVASRASLHYTEAFLWECLRHASVLTLSMPHKPLQDSKLNGYHIPKDAELVANFWAVNMDPNIWPEPKKFRPERHLDAEGHVVKQDNVIVFGQGRRMCLGEQLVKAEAFMFVACLLQRFTFRFPENEAPPDLDDVSKGVIRRPPACRLCAIPR